MCGIAGIYYFDSKTQKRTTNYKTVLQLLSHRGPDNQAFKEFENCTFFHARLKIIDTSEASNQPFLDIQNKNCLIFNGEIFNYKTLQKQQTDLKTNGDVEVLFNLLKMKGVNCLNELNGFFAFSFFDSITNNLIIAKDRLGIKPLYYYKDNEKFAFASELKPLLELVGPQELNHNQINTYFRLNYCSGPETIFKNIYRLQPGHYINIQNASFDIINWYKAPISNTKNDPFSLLLEDAVKLRLNADVPVGTFLSGGIDSSIISALAKKNKPDLQTFSIGFKDADYFDETNYAEIVAKHINSNHHVFKLSENDFVSNIQAFLNSIDEPFADSSAFNFFILSKHTKNFVKVALSGDGADELFKGYSKHKALLMSKHPLYAYITKPILPILNIVPSSRQGFFSNKARQLKKFNHLVNLTAIEKQKYLASISTQAEVDELLLYKNNTNYFNDLFQTTANYFNFDLSTTFDLQTVLADDMLVKADRFSMQQGIEIRNPFLDYRIVEYALNLNNNEKINYSHQKIILKKEFGNLLPKQIFDRSKKGFELPLQKWLCSKSFEQPLNKLLNSDKINSEGLLNQEYIDQIYNQLNSKNPEDSAAKLWAIIIFESWLTNFKSYIKTNA